MKVSDRKYEPTVEENECNICGKDLDGKDNEAKCESCLKSYHVACMNISHEDKLNNISLVWICLCGYNNISVRMFDHLGIPTDINQYESISPKHEIIEESDGKDDDCFIPREKARDKKGRFVKKKSHGDDFASVSKKEDITSLGELKTGPLTNYTHQDSLLNKIEESLENCDGCIMNFETDGAYWLTMDTVFYFVLQAGKMTDLQKYRVHAGGKKGQVQGRNKKGQFRKKNKEAAEVY